MTALPTIVLDPPTISMTFGVNDSPLAGRDGTHVSCVLATPSLINIFCYFLLAIWLYLIFIYFLILTLYCD